MRWCSVVLLFAAAFSASAKDLDLAEAEALYMQECSKCHGLMPAAETALLRVKYDNAANQVAMALPYGPALRGIIGQTAGSVPAYEYSKAFRTLLQGLIWSEQTLDIFMTSSQDMAPGIRMYYRQPDADIRRKIIAFLSANP